MGRVLQLESIGGASGDMLLGALTGLGVSVEELNETLRSLQVDPFEIVVDEVVVQGMSGVRARVVLEEAHGHRHDHEHNHEHNHDHEHDHDHEHNHDDEHHHDHEHDHDHGRHLSTILKLIEASALPMDVKTEAAAVFRRIGEAEAAIHGIDIEQIHFHEVGAMDSIVDIVGCCLAKHLLGVDEVVIRSLPAGHGTLTCAHGVYPNPAPATVRILEGFPVEAVDEPFELVTPTGAALISEWRTGAAPVAGLRAVKSAYSFGQRTLSKRPNLLRATLLDAGEDCTAKQCEVVACNLDDMTPELIGELTQRLLKEGALDVTTQAVMMKKQRPGILLEFLCLREQRESLLRLLFRESSTFGVRYYAVERDVLERSFEKVQTEHGEVSIKLGYRDGACMSVAPEMDDCVALAERAGVSVERVYRAAWVAWEEKSR
tara:strand:+ start:2009 stop:3301 length:1293 start_codon:yes stop_codon:yes gene_type:complete